MRLVATEAMRCALPICARSVAMYELMEEMMLLRSVPRACVRSRTTGFLSLVVSSRRLRSITIELYCPMADCMSALTMLVLVGRGWS